MSVGVKKTIRDVLIIGACGIVYYLITRFTPFKMKCTLHELTGLQCPSCGATRMVTSATKLDFRAAFGYNRFIFLTFPYMIYEAVYLIYVNESKALFRKSNKIVLFIWLGLFVLYGILRNIIPI